MGQADFVRRLLDRVAVGIGDAVFRYDVANGRIHAHGPGTEALLGYDARHLQSLGPDELWALVHSDDHGRLAAAVDESARLGDEQATTATLRIRHADGSWRCVRAAACVLSRDPAAGGQPASLFIVLHPSDPACDDPAEGCASAILADLLEHVPESLTVTGGPPGYHVIARSRRAAELFGQPFRRVSDLAAGQGSGGLYAPHAEQPSRLEQIPALRAVRAGEVIAGEEWTVRRPDGSAVQVEVHAVPVRQGRGVVAAVSSWREVSERRRLEQALREKTEQLSLVVKSTRVCLWSYDFASRALTWSEECRTLFMWPCDRALSQESFLASVHDADRQRVAEAFELGYGEGAAIDIEFRVPLPHGEVRWISAFGETFNGDDGEPLYLFGAMTDLTAHKRAQEALRESERRFRDLLARAQSGGQRDRSGSAK